MIEPKKSDLMRTIFDAMPSLVLVVDEDVKVQEYNLAAAEFFLADRIAILKHRGGEVINCIYSTEVPGGCGHAESCGGCVVRNAVKSSFDGNRIVRSRAKMEVLRGGEKVEMYALITASPFVFGDENLALLVIEDINVIAELQKMLPICSVCNKIKDEKKAWLRIETYFKDHWDVDFSHSLCPECYKGEMEKIDKAFSPAGSLKDVKCSNIE